MFVSGPCVAGVRLMTVKERKCLRFTTNWLTSLCEYLWYFLIVTPIVPSLCLIECSSVQVKFDHCGFSRLEPGAAFDRLGITASRWMSGFSAAASSHFSQYRSADRRAASEDVP
jgi:hypothetical protein